LDRQLPPRVLVVDATAVRVMHTSGKQSGLVVCNKDCVAAVVNTPQTFFALGFVVDASFEIRFVEFDVFFFCCTFL
jgi:uncharacterized membrane protein